MGYLTVPCYCASSGPPCGLHRLDQVSESLRDMTMRDRCLVFREKERLRKDVNREEVNKGFRSVPSRQCYLISFYHTQPPSTLGLIQTQPIRTPNWKPNPQTQPIRTSNWKPNPQTQPVGTLNPTPNLKIQPIGKPN